MTPPKRVHCVCPQRHVLLIAQVSPKLDDAQAIEVTRQEVQDVIRVRGLCCPRCGALPGTWVIEVPPQSGTAETQFDELVSAGAQSFEELQIWKRPARRKGWLN